MSYIINTERILGSATAVQLRAHGFPLTRYYDKWLRSAEESCHLVNLLQHSLGIQSGFRCGVSARLEELCSWYDDPVRMALLLMQANVSIRSVLAQLIVHHSRVVAYRALRAILRFERRVRTTNPAAVPWWYPHVYSSRSYKSRLSRRLFAVPTGAIGRIPAQAALAALDEYDRRTQLDFPRSVADIHLSVCDVWARFSFLFLSNVGKPTVSPEYMFYCGRVRFWQAMWRPVTSSSEVRPALYHVYGNTEHILRDVEKNTEGTYV